MTDRVAPVRVFRAVVVIASLLLFILFSTRPHDIGIAQSAGLVAAYGFNEATGTAVTDASGNANNGTIVV